MLFKKKKDPLKTYVKDNLDSGLKKMIIDGLIDMNSSLAGVHVSNYIGHMKKSYVKSAAMLSIHYSVSYPEVLKKIDETVEEFNNQWLK